MGRKVYGPYTREEFAWLIEALTFLDEFHRRQGKHYPFGTIEAALADLIPDPHEELNGHEKKGN
jgi:hypothetical protein